MKYVIIGDNSNISRKETKTLTKFLFRELFPGKKRKQLKRIHELVVDYRSANKLNESANLEGVSGFMQHNETNLGFDIVVWVQPKMSRMETIKTFCHEFVHIEQEIIDNADENNPDVPYEQNPWENEAFDLETGLYNKYIQTHTIESVHRSWILNLIRRLFGIRG